MGLGVIDSKLLVDAYGGQTTAPIPGQWINLDVAWGPLLAGDPAQAVSTTLSCPGATIDTTYNAPVIGGHQVNLGGRTGLDMGWSPNGSGVYVSPVVCAMAFWRIQFPTAGSYTITLSGVGTIDVTTGSAPVLTRPTYTMLANLPMGRVATNIFALSFNGTYPAGGLDFLPSDIGLSSVEFGEINDTSSYRFSWAANKLRVWLPGGGEASGTINFATRALFVGLAA